MLLEHVIERSRLRESTRISVHHETFRSIVAVEAFGDEVVYKFVGDEKTSFDVGMSSHPQRCACADGFA